MADVVLPRGAAAVLADRLAVFRGVVVQGPRQAGKTTMVRSTAPKAARYVTLDDAATRTAAEADPHGFARLAAPLLIDEFQRGDDGLLLAIKERLDQSTARGQVVLTGSSSFLASRRLTETLAGRVGFVDVLPLSQGEILGTGDRLLQVLRDGPAALRSMEPEPWPAERYAEAIARGGYPEVVTKVPPGRERAWFAAYLQTVVEREVPSIGGVSDRLPLRRSLAAMAAMTSRQINISELAGRIGITRQTLANHVDVLAAVFLLQLLPAWSPEPLRRLTKGPKLHLVDSGLAAALLNWDAGRLADPAFSPAGALWESFVVAELRKQAAWSEPPPTLLHARDKGGRHEVDVVVEWPDGRIVGIEVKRARSLRARDAAGLAWLRDQVGTRLIQGVVLHGGSEVLPLGDRLSAAPISVLWA